MPALKYTHVHGSSHVEIYPTLDEAIRSAVYAADNGSEALDYIEYQGYRYSWGDPEVERVDAEIRRREKEAEKNWVKPTHIVQIQDLGGHWYELGRGQGDEVSKLLKEAALAVPPERIKSVKCRW
jgi:hypothetical protein